MKARILVGLSKLDASNDNHWTAEGLPRLETLRMLVGDPSITRESVTLAAPSFSRGQTIELPPTVPATKVGGTPAEGAEGGAGQAETAQGAANSDVDSQLDGDDDETQGGADTGEDTDPELDPGTEREPTPQEIVASLKHELEEVQGYQEAARARCILLQNEIAKIEDEIERNRPPEDNPIAKYLAGQKRVLEERARVKRAIGDSGVQLVALQKLLKSPLDAKLAQRRQMPPRR